MTRKECLNAAIDAVCKDRENTYGSPEDVAAMMILLKTARAKNSNHNDNFVDIAGYAACAAEIGEPEKQEKPKFRLEDYQGNYAMHCNTKEKAAVFCRFLHEHGKKWRNGESFMQNTNWNIFEQETVYCLNYFTYDSIDYAKQNNYQVLEFDSFDWSEVWPEMRNGEEWEH